MPTLNRQQPNPSKILKPRNTKQWVYVYYFLKNIAK